MKQIECYELTSVFSNDVNPRVFNHTNLRPTNDFFEITQSKNNITHRIFISHEDITMLYAITKGELLP